MRNAGLRSIDRQSLNQFEEDLMNLGVTKSTPPTVRS